MERLTIKNSDGTHSQSSDCTFEKMFNNLVEFEDFMEEQGFESLEDLKSKLNKKFHIYNDDVRQGKVFNGVFFSFEQLMVMDEWAEFNTNYFKKYLDSQQENQALKDRWEKLKEYIIKEINKEGDGDFACAEEDILDKMRELELTELIRRKEE